MNATTTCKNDLEQEKIWQMLHFFFGLLLTFFGFSIWPSFKLTCVFHIMWYNTGWMEMINLATTRKFINLIFVLLLIHKSYCHSTYEMKSNCNRGTLYRRTHATFPPFNLTYRFSSRYQRKQWAACEGGKLPQSCLPHWEVIGASNVRVLVQRRSSHQLFQQRQH